MARRENWAGATRRTLEKVGLTSKAIAGVDSLSFDRNISVTTGDPASQIHFGELEDSGGYLTSANPDNAFLSGGARWSGAQWIAVHTTAGLLGTSSSGVALYADTGLTIGNSYSPTLRLRITTNGNITMPTLPTADPVFAGALWNDSGTVKISAG